eukprot:767156-Hanusia_phi.AAC.1
MRGVLQPISGFRFPDLCRALRSLLCQFDLDTKGRRLFTPSHVLLLLMSRFLSCESVEQDGTIRSFDTLRSLQDPEATEFSSFSSPSQLVTSSMLHPYLDLLAVGTGARTYEEIDEQENIFDCALLIWRLTGMETDDPPSE